MTIEARIKTKNGDRIYRGGLQEISFGDDQLYLYYEEEEVRVNGFDISPDNTEVLEGAVVEVVRAEGGRSLEERDNLFSEFHEHTESVNKSYKYK